MDKMKNMRQFSEQERHNMYTTLLKFFGHIQFVVILEELAELAKEVSKYIRGHENKNHIVEEIADVEIVLEELKLFLDLDEERIDQMRTFKLNRIKKTIDMIGELEEVNVNH